MAVRRAMDASQLARMLGRSGRAGPYYRAIAASVRDLVLDGRLPLHVRLPAERDLAAALGVSRTTVTGAYDELRADGYVTSRRGSGSFTALPPFPPAGSAPTSAVRRQENHVVDLSVAALPAPDALPDAVARAVEELPGYVSGHGYDPLGLPTLRHALAEHYTARGLATAPEQILVTAGAQHAFNLVLRLLVSPGDAVLVESPTYPAALDAARGAGARLVPVGMTHRGWDMEMTSVALRQSAPRLAYLIPDFHNPTGHLMGDTERAAIVHAARRSGASVVVDETFAGLAIDPSSRPRPLAAHDRDGQVITIGSASKTYWGGLRIGWVRAGTPLVHRLASTRASLDIASPVLEQLVVTELLAAAGEVAAQRRAQLAARRAALAQALGRELPMWGFALPSGGMSLWVRLDAPVSGALADIAPGHGVRVTPGPRFSAEGALEHGLRIPYAQPPEMLVDAASRLAAARRAVRERGGPALAPVCV